MTDMQIILIVSAGACLTVPFAKDLSTKGDARAAAVATLAFIGLPLGAACYLLTLAARLPL
jgi:hypothetical protein